MEETNKEKGFIQVVFVLVVVAIAGVFLITKYYGYIPYSIGNPNMIPQYAPGQLWVVRTNYKNIQRNDVIAFKIPQNPQYSNLARVVGLPGEIIMVKGGKVFINDKQIEEPYLPPNMTTGDGKSLLEDNKKTIPQNEYAVLADNRSNGMDTRDYGLISSSNFLGKVAFCYRNCDKSDSSIIASFIPNLKSDEILNLINQYRQSKKLQPWVTTQELCNLAEKRANYLVSNHREPLKSSVSDFQKNFESQVKDYPGASINEIHISDVTTNQEAVAGWKKFPDNDKFLLMTEANGAQITKACASVRTDRASSLIVLLSGSDSSLSKSAITPQNSSNTKTTTLATPAITTLNYSQENIDAWKTQIGYLNRDIQSTQNFINSPRYDQAKIQKLNSLLNQMKTIADRIYNKMIQKQVLTTQDDRDITNYNNYYKEEQILVKELFNN